MGRRITEKAERLAFQMDSAARERPEFRHGDVVHFFSFSRGPPRSPISAEFCDAVHLAGVFQQLAM